ncbi:uncharacterized protein [Cherax quadricarinatus]|uniref:uncharacterized protein isoform X2 n=1 Tax=Cherax quadricarinatus TaxID=27406 RepID=UPI00387E7F0D
MRVMYPIPQNASPVQWILAQVAAKCGVSNKQQLTDSLLHLITLDSNPSNLVSAPSDQAFSSISQNIPVQYHINLQEGHFNGTPFAGLATSINTNNNFSTNNSHLYTFSANSVISGECFGNCGVSGVGGASVVGIESDSKQSNSQPQVHLSAQLCNLETSVEKVLCLLPNPKETRLSEACFLGGAQVRMVVPVLGQDAVKNIQESNNSKNCNKNSTITKNRNNSKNNSKNKELVKSVESENNGEQYSPPKHCFNYRVIEYKPPLDKNEEKCKDDQFSVSQLPASNKALDAKEVEKLLQNVLWKSNQHEKKTEGGVETTGSGGCDTGYSSRCSTPPGPSCLSDAIDPKHGTKRHLDVPARRSTNNSNCESRSGSPSACSVSSQGSYRNPRQKRRYNNNSDGQNIHHNNHAYSHHHPLHQNQPHQPHHQSNHQPYHQSNHQPHHQSNNQSHQPHLRSNYPYINYHHNQYHNHPNHHGGYMGNGSVARGNGQYYNQHCPDLAYRDCSNFQSQRYEKGYNNYGYFGHIDHRWRDFNQHIGDERYGRFNQGRVYSKYNANQYNAHCLPLSDSTLDQSRCLSGRAGTFSEERINVYTKWKCEVVETPSELLTGTEWDGLTKQVWDTFRRHQQKNDTFYKKLKLREKIFKVIRNVLPNCRLYVVGSSLSGFGADCSDVDMCLMVTPGDLDQRTEATAVLRLLQRELNNCGSIQKMELIRAKVPILKFRDATSQVDVDLNCNNAVGIRNTHLLNSYSQLDWRVRPLVLVVKLWAQYHNINNAKDMTISSYSLVLMVIHYLQHGVEPPVLPCLQKTFPEKFRAYAQITSIPVTEKMPTFTSNNHDSLGKLLHGFLDYFANKFTFIEETISVRTGGTVPTAHCRNVKSRKNDTRMWKYLCIEEPFDLTNTARSVYDETVFERVKKVFVDSYKLLNEKSDLACILT